MPTPRLVSTAALAAELGKLPAFSTGTAAAAQNLALFPVILPVGLQADINTAECGFLTTPCYTARIQGPRVRHFKSSSGTVEVDFTAIIDGMPQIIDQAEVDMLILGDDGKLFVRRSQVDLNDPERKKREETWRKWLEIVQADTDKFRNDAAQNQNPAGGPTGPAGPGRPGGGGNPGG